MSTLAVELQPQAYDIKCTDTSIIVELIDGRTISVPLVWFPRLSQASKEQLENWELLGNGEGIHGTGLQLFSQEVYSKVTVSDI